MAIKKVLSILAMLLLAQPVMSASWEWDDSVIDEVKENNNPNEYCPEASQENKETYCIELSDWSQISLENDNIGLDNILTIYRETSNDDGEMNNEELDMFLSLYTCYEESTDSVAQCVDENNMELHPEEKMDITVFPDLNQEDQNNDGEEESNNEEENQELVEEIQYEDSDGEILVSVSENGGTGYYGMHDNSLEGEFTVSGSISAFNVNLDVWNEQNDEFLQNPTFPLTTEADSDSFSYLADGQCNEFRVEAEHADDSDTLKEATFQFKPDLGEESGNDITCE